MYMYYPKNRAWSFYVERLIDETVQDGADFNECHRTLQRIPDGNSEAWYAEWMKTAEHIERLAQEAAEKGHWVTAKDSFFRAFTYYRTAQFWIEYEDPRKTPAFLKALACFQKANSIVSPSYERVEIPFEGTTLPGYFCPAQGRGNGKRPVVLYVGGADTFAEQLLFMGVSRITKRGISCLTMTGPGQGEVLRVKKIHSRPDYERPIAAALDFLERRKDVDPKKMGVMGVSMGGYYAARGASLDERVAACLLFGACYSVLEDLYDYFPPLQSSLRWIVGAKGPDEARKVVETFTLKGVIDKMKCPLLINHGAEDFIVSPSAAHKTYADARCPKEMRIWRADEGGSSHCMGDNRAQAYAYMFDWLADQLS
ncbi:MAG: alpha/beta hydrolase [Deltaproteobacteria bacterium]|nr:alpha/beta hydrolase [Deltaproteobacteria bacterium]